MGPKKKKIEMSQMFYGQINLIPFVRMEEFKEIAAVGDQDSDLEHELDVQDDPVVHGRTFKYHIR
jgi:hypothetical protein